MANAACDGVQRRCPQEGIATPEDAVIIATSPRPVLGISSEHRHHDEAKKGSDYGHGQQQDTNSTADHQPLARPATATAPHAMKSAPC
jgi:hypothetical protein